MYGDIVNYFCVAVILSPVWAVTKRELLNVRQLCYLGEQFTELQPVLGLSGAVVQDLLVMHKSLQGPDHQHHKTYKSQVIC